MTPLTTSQKREMLLASLLRRGKSVAFRNPDAAEFYRPKLKADIVWVEEPSMTDETTNALYSLLIPS